MNWKQLISNKRLGLEHLHEARKDDRTEFQRDYDRLIFSAPFRRLQNKTQVFPLPGSVFVHNRLTHSLEVACVGRSLGNEVSRLLLRRSPGLTETHIGEAGAIVSAACLAHDLGNPAFRTFGREGYSNVLYRGKGDEPPREADTRAVERHNELRGECECFPPAYPPVQGAKAGRVRDDVFHTGIDSEISVCVGTGGGEAEVRVLHERAEGVREDSGRTRNKEAER